MKSHGDVAVVFELASLAEGGEGFEDFFDSFGAVGGCAAEGFSDLLGVGAGQEVGKGCVDGAGLFGEGFGPRLFFERLRFLFGGGFVRRSLTYVDGGLFLAGGVLEVGSEPADYAAAFFVGALVIKGDKAGKDFFVGEVGGPAVGIGDGGVEVVVNLAEDGDEALLVNRLFFGVERLAGAELFEDVVHAGHRERGMQLLLTLAMSVELFAEFANARLLDFTGIWERKLSEAITVIVV